ncbi:hypothetical protein GOV04_01375 [Candidatus Woesearchaeota archaeon]|nr:hypothetical protein [Candidatus Woesearchaeota archaeon]
MQQQNLIEKIKKLLLNSKDATNSLREQAREYSIEELVLNNLKGLEVYLDIPTNGRGLLSVELEQHPDKNLILTSIYELADKGPMKVEAALRAMLSAYDAGATLNDAVDAATQKAYDLAREQREYTNDKYLV